MLQEGIPRTKKSTAGGGEVTAERREESYVKLRFTRLQPKGPSSPLARAVTYPSKWHLVYSRLLILQ